MEISEVQAVDVQVLNPPLERELTKKLCTMNVAIVGLGYVGLPLALLAQSKGHAVVGIDISAEKIDLIRKGVSPISDADIDHQLKDLPLNATTDFKKIEEAEVIVLCVPTPIFQNSMPNLEPLKSACRSVAHFLQPGQLVILESTVNPGVSETIVLPILEEISGLKGGQDFFLAHCPERINPGDDHWKIESINRVVGSLEERGLAKALEFYRSILDGTVTQMNSLKEAEAVKIVENAFRDVNIAFVNELAQSFSRLGIDIVRVIEGASTKPFAFMPHYPGCGVGGHCVPVDPYYLIEYAKENGFNHDFLSLARRINNEMPDFTAELVAKGLNQKKIPINGSAIAVLGLAYKPEIDDCRESPAFKIIESLKEYGADVISYDPFVPFKSSASSLDEALEASKAVVVVTAHRQFREITPEYLRKKGIEVVVDGRNCLPKDEFAKTDIVYIGIGR